MTPETLSIDMWKTAQQIDERLNDLAGRIDRELAGEPLTVMGVLPYSFIFMSDLIRKLKTPVRCNFLSIYFRGMVGAREEAIRQIDETIVYPPQNLSEQNVLILSMVLDTGVIMDHALNHIRMLGARSVRAGALLDKAFLRRVDLRPEYVGFETSDPDYIFGYGLDYQGRYQNLPYLAKLK